MTVPRPEKTVKVIGLGLRVAAFLVDSLIVWVAGLLLGILVATAGLLLTMYLPGRPIPLDGLIVLSGLAFSVVYFVLAWAKSGQTLGKMAVGIKVIGADGQPPSIGKAVLRYIGYFISGIALSLGFLWVAFDQERQGWHDKLAKTYIVYSDVDFGNADTITFTPNDPRPGWGWIILWVFLLVSMPLTLIATLWGLGPYVGQFLANLFGG